MIVPLAKSEGSRFTVLFIGPSLISNWPPIAFSIAADDGFQVNCKSVPVRSNFSPRLESICNSARGAFDTEPRKRNIPSATSTAIIKATIAHCRLRWLGLGLSNTCVFSSAGTLASCGSSAIRTGSFLATEGRTSVRSGTPLPESSARLKGRGLHSQATAPSFVRNKRPFVE